jgi:hypothetical protein
VAVKILPPIVLSSRYYAELERQARAQERDALQQARWLLKRALETERPADLTTSAVHPAAAPAAP